MTDLAAPQSEQPLPVQGEMRLATVMMVDIVGSTEISERLGPERSFSLLQDVLSPARATVADYGGFTMDEMGDGIFALFGAPHSVERASLAACRAGLAICEGVHKRAESFVGRFGLVPQVRVGLAEGEVLITGIAENGDRRATGSPVNLAARLQTLADPGTVVCSAGVAADSRGWARFQPLGARQLKGFSAAVETFQLLAVDAAREDQPIGTSRFAGDFVGRGAEIAGLLRWHSGQDGNRALSLIVGDAGIGKSRLLGELAARMQDRRLLLGACQPTVTARALAPVIEILRSFVGWRPDASPGEILAAAGPILPERAADCDILMALIADEAPAVAENSPSYAIALRRALSEAIVKLGQRPDCLIAIEDVHWIDPLSAEVLLTIIAAAPDGFRMLGTTRPADWIGRLPKDRVEITVAGPMPATEIAVIAQAMMGEAADETLVGRVTERSEGNPFFAIEILHSVAAKGGGVDPGRIGAIQNIALARFDLLDPMTKALLRLAAVLGRSFRLDVLRTAARIQDDDITRLMSAAEGIIEPDPTDPGVSGWFHHILFRDSIYVTVPSAARRTLHHAAAQAIETCLGIGAGTADALADHYELAEDRHHAVTHLRAAARHAYSLYAMESCRSLTERAFRLMEPALDFDPAEVEDTLLLRIRCLDVLDQFREVVSMSTAWLPRIPAASGSAAQAQLMALTSKAHCHLANFEESHRMILEALRMATEAANARATAYAKVVLMRVLADSQPNSVAEVERLFEETREETERLSDDPIYANRMFHLMSAYRTEGLMGRALAVNAELMAYGQRHKQPHDILVGHWSRGMLAGESNDPQTQLHHAQIVLQNSARHSAVWDIGMMQTLVSNANLGQDIPDGAIRSIYERADKRGEFVTRNAAALWLGIADLVQGKIAAGWRQVRWCEDLFNQTATLAYSRHYLLGMSELMLMVGGFIKLGGRKPKLGLKDVAVAIYIRLIARRAATAMIARLLSQFERQEGHFVARAHICLAVIDASHRKAASAGSHFDLAERLLQAEGLAAELARLSQIRAATNI